MKTQILTAPLLHPASANQKRPATELRLSARNILRLEGRPQGTKITVLSGKTWLTQENDPKDHLLGCGESMEIKRNGLVLVQGWPEAVLKIAPAH
jgi:hypothetical protein